MVHSTQFTRATQHELHDLQVHSRRQGFGVTEKHDLTSVFDVSIFDVVDEVTSGSEHHPLFFQIG
jgi:hypothetical protein